MIDTDPHIRPELGPVKVAETSSSRILGVWHEAIAASRAASGPAGAQRQRHAR